jgi:hypothetical protein
VALTTGRQERREQMAPVAFVRNVLTRAAKDYEGLAVAEVCCPQRQRRSGAFALSTPTRPRHEPDR